MLDRKIDDCFIFLLYWRQHNFLSNIFGHLNILVFFLVRGVLGVKIGKEEGWGAGRRRSEVFFV